MDKDDWSIFLIPADYNQVLQTAKQTTKLMNYTFVYEKHMPLPSSFGLFAFWFVFWFSCYKNNIFTSSVPMWL